MSDPTISTPRRQITGLRPRANEFDVSGLTRGGGGGRPAPTTRPATQAPAPAAPSRARAQERESAKVNVSVYLPVELRDRARAAYRATAHLHDDSSWSAYVSRAVELLTQAREEEHNGGTPYVPDQQPLTPGRPLT